MAPNLLRFLYSESVFSGSRVCSTTMDEITLHNSVILYPAPGTSYCANGVDLLHIIVSFLFVHSLTDVDQPDRIDSKNSIFHQNIRSCKK